jgi:hypothetical protein
VYVEGYVLSSVHSVPELAAHTDPMLWIPDAVAWSWVKGGEWRDCVAPYSTVIRV